MFPADLPYASELMAEVLRAAEQCPRERLPGLLGALEEVRAVCQARWLKQVPETAMGVEVNKLLTAEEVAARLGVSKAYVYRNADSWPFTKRLGENTVRFCDSGLCDWIANDV